jgi:hypothetical protein
MILLLIYFCGCGMAFYEGYNKDGALSATHGDMASLIACVFVALLWPALVLQNLIKEACR